MPQDEKFPYFPRKYPLGNSVMIERGRLNEIFFSLLYIFSVYIFPSPWLSHQKN